MDSRSFVGAAEADQGLFHYVLQEADKEGNKPRYCHLYNLFFLSLKVKCYIKILGSLSLYD